MRNRLNYKANNTANNKEKQTWPEELWEWASKLIKWTCDALFNTLAAWVELTMAWTSKLSEKFWNKNPDIKSSRQAITQHHLNQTKKALNKAWTWVWNMATWVFKTAKWGVRTIFSSGKNTIKWLREDESSNTQENNQENNQENKKD